MYLKKVHSKVNKTTRLLCKLQDTLPRTWLITIFKLFIRTHLDYGDIIYDWAYNTSFHQNIESIQFNAELAITGAVRGNSREKLYQELGVESLYKERLYRKLCCLFKIINSQSPRYLFQLVASTKTKYFAVKHDFFKYSFSPLLQQSETIWTRISENSKSISIFKSNILKFIRPKTNNVYYCHNPKGFRLLTRLRLGLSHSKFKHSFQDCLNPLSFCSNETETSTHDLLHCLTYTNERMTILNKIKSINCSILEFSDAVVTIIHLFADNTLVILPS